MEEAIAKLEGHIEYWDEQWAIYGTSSDRYKLEHQCGVLDGLKQALKVLKGEI